MSHDWQMADCVGITDVADQYMLEMSLIAQGGTAGEGGGEIAGAAGDGLEEGDAGPACGRGRLWAAQEAVDGQQLEQRGRAA